jgi:hypothetical protein
MVELESNSLHTEKSDSEARAKEIQESPLKLDAHGIPLLPQPSDRKDDPLVCSVLPDVNNQLQWRLELCRKTKVLIHEF